MECAIGRLSGTVICCGKVRPRIVQYQNRQLFSDMSELATLVPDFDLGFFLTVDEVNNIARPPKKLGKNL
jgi:hypothetical protein